MRRMTIPIHICAAQGMVVNDLHVVGMKYGINHHDIMPMEICDSLMT